jgi:regulatory protein
VTPWLGSAADILSSKKLQNKNRDLLQKAKNYAFLLLKFRPRSEKEVYQRLKKKKFDEQVIKETLVFLKDKDFLNDTFFAKAWIESRLKRPLGLRRIKQELKIKGIDNKIIDNQIKEIKEDYAEGNIVAKIAQKKFSQLRDIELEKAKRRIFSYLVRRGFSPDVVIDVVNECCKL